jgi:F-type H+-transporting ATPase subunit delta
MTSSALVTRYANALADVVLGGAIDPVLAVQNLRTFEATVQAAPLLQVALASPAISATRKRQVIGRIADALELHRIIRNFLFVLCDRHRSGDISAMIAQFDVALDARMGLTRAEVATAYELTEAQRVRVAQELEQTIGGRVRAHFSVDPELIGGATARLGSKVYDGSVRGRLESLRLRLVVQ